MTSTSIRIGTIAACSLFVAGCGNIFPYTSTLESEKRFLGQDSAIMTKAEQRALLNINVPEKDRGFGRVIPTRIICAEPSPDVAKAVSEGISGAFSAAQGQGEGAFAASRSYAEAIAQLGERLATIQILRDGLYRACEAYANGAMTDTVYAVIVSGIDDAMVTLHTAEIAGGAFGRELASIEGTAGGEPSASANVTVTSSDSEEESDDNSGNDGASEESEEERDSQLEASAESSASTSADAGGGTMGAQDSKVAASVAQIQKNFLDFRKEDKLSALVIACIAALDRPVKETTPFIALCEDGLPKVLNASLKSEGEE